MSAVVAARTFNTIYGHRHFDQFRIEGKIVKRRSSFPFAGRGAIELCVSVTRVHRQQKHMHTHTREAHTREAHTRVLAPGTHGGGVGVAQICFV